MTCAKAVVKARLVTTSGQVFEGENAVLMPQAQCPRLAGEGYDKCISVCDQQGHAEAMAIVAARDAGATLRGAHMQVFYHHVCDACQGLMRSLAITWELADGNR